MNSEQAIERLKEAKAAAATGAEFAPEYIEKFGVKFFYKTVSHAWVISAVVARFPKSSDFEKGLIVLYLLSLSPEEVRNRAMQEAEEGRILESAIQFMEEHGISPEDAEKLDHDVQKLMSHPYKKK
jgi:hypothetical protein